MKRFLEALRTRIPLALLAGSAAVAFALGSGWWFALGIAAAVVVAAGAALSPTARRRAALETAPGIDDTVLEAVGTLERRLGALAARPSVAQPADRGRMQLGRAHDAYVAFAGVLGQRFDPGELTYGRYLEAGRQVYLALLDGLARAATELDAIADVDARGVASALRQQERRGDEDSAEVTALRTRLALCDDALRSAGEALAENDQALNELTNAATGLARIETSRGLARADGDRVMVELQALVDRAEQYAILPHQSD